jgi:hypothetical protein
VYCSVEVAEFDAEGRECRQRIDDASTAVAGMVVEVVGIRALLNSAVDADRVCDPVVFPPSAGVAEFRAGEHIAECTPGECLLQLRVLFVGVASGRPPAMEDSQLSDRIEGRVTGLVNEHPFLGDRGNYTRLDEVRGEVPRAGLIDVLGRNLCGVLVLGYQFVFESLMIV